MKSIARIACCMIGLACCQAAIAAPATPPSRGIPVKPQYITSDDTNAVQTRLANRSKLTKKRADLAKKAEQDRQAAKKPAAAANGKH